MSLCVSRASSTSPVGTVTRPGILDASVGSSAVTQRRRASDPPLSCVIVVREARVLLVIRPLRPACSLSHGIVGCDEGGVFLASTHLSPAFRPRCPPLAACRAWMPSRTSRRRWLCCGAMNGASTPPASVMRSSWTNTSGPSRANGSSRPARPPQPPGHNARGSAVQLAAKLDERLAVKSTRSVVPNYTPRRWQEYKRWKSYKRWKEYIINGGWFLAA